MHEENLPIVAIVGKPNVGKSSLFNRLIRSRKAIVFDEPGVTRDVIYGIVRHGDLEYRVADSTGFVSDTETLRLHRRLIDEASLILFTCDTDGLSGEDFEITEVVRKSGKPCILVVNKADNDTMAQQIYDFYDLDIEEPIAVSAIHGNNITILRDRIAQKLLSLRKEPVIEQSRHTAIDIAIVGKPNVGKSSILNLIVGRPRSLVTPLPGTTRDTVDETIEFSGQRLQFVDTAGIRKKRKNLPSVEYFSILRAERAIKNSTVAVLLIDAESGITSQDKKIASIIVQERKGLIIAANKWDIAKKKGADFKSFRGDLYYEFPHVRFADVIPVSAVT